MKIVRTLLAIGATATLSLATALPSFAGPAEYTSADYSASDYVTKGYIIGNEPGSRVNVRSAPSVYAASPNYGLVGDRVDIISGVVGDDGYYWYYVEFPSSSQGWIRGDFIYEEPAH